MTMLNSKERKWPLADLVSVTISFLSYFTPMMIFSSKFPTYYFWELDKHLFFVNRNNNIFTVAPEKPKLSTTY